MKDWTTYLLGDFLKRQFDSVSVDDKTTYKRITIKTKGQGIELRDTVEGATIGTKNQYRARANQFLLSKIDAMNGAFGIVPEICDNGIITGNFWTYNLNEDLIDRDYLRLLCRKQVFTNFSISASEGTTNRRYLREDKFLRLEIPLPSLPEQGRIVDEIGSVTKKLQRIESLRAEQSKDINNLLFSRYSEIVDGVNWLPLTVVAPIQRRPVQIGSDHTYNEVGARSFFKGLFEKESFRGDTLTWEKPHWLKAGDLVFSNIKAWEGAVALVPPKYDSWVASHRYITCVPSEMVVPEYLLYLFSTAFGLEILNAASPGSADRNRTLNTKKLMNARVPIPELPVQIEFVNLLHKIEVLRAYYRQTKSHLDQLVPSLLDKALTGNL